jgi:plastocyanin
MVLITAAALAVAAAAWAEKEIRIEDNKFVPKDVVVPKGEMIKWTNYGAVVHTSTSDTQIWDSGDIRPNQFFKRKFNQTGTFPYHCRYHALMKGSIRVTETPVTPESFGRVKALFH